MNTNPRYSILIPVYNVKPYLSECFDSIINQKGIKSFEVIVVDDGSTDGGGDICDDYARKDSRFRVFHNVNHGLIFSRRFALEKAKGEYIVFLDSDDCLENNALQIIDDTFSMYCCDCVIYGLRQVYNNKTMYINTERDTILVSDKKELFKKYFLTDKYNNIWRKAVKKSVFDGRDYSEFFHLQMSEDVLQSVEIIENSESVVFLKDILYVYRMNPNSITQTIDYKKYKIDYSIREYVLRRIKHCNVFGDNDWEQYKEMCLNALCTEIVGIASGACSRKNRYELFLEIKATKYYQEFLSSGKLSNSSKKQRLVWKLFKRGHYRILCQLFELYQKCKKHRSVHF